MTTLPPQFTRLSHQPARQPASGANPGRSAADHAQQHWRNSFQELFEGTAPPGLARTGNSNPQPALAQTQASFSPPGSQVLTRVGSAATGQAAPELSRSAAVLVAEPDFVEAGFTVASPEAAAPTPTAAASAAPVPKTTGCPVEPSAEAPSSAAAPDSDPTSAPATSGNAGPSAGSSPAPASAPSSTPAAVTSASGAAASIPADPGTDLSEYSPLNPPVSLAPLPQEMARQGLDISQFQFTELSSYEAFPGRPDLSFYNRQLLIQGPNGSKLFDLGLALQSPWVTAVELKSYGIA
jgi:hypothetical protein